MRVAAKRCSVWCIRDGATCLHGISGVYRYLKITFLISSLKVSWFSICLIASGIWFHSLGPSTMKSLSHDVSPVRGAHSRSQAALLVGMLCTSCTYTSLSTHLGSPFPVKKLYIMLLICWQHLWYKVEISNSSCMSTIGVYCVLTRIHAERFQPD